jgi:uncharacterized protein (DUF427 family)
MWKGVVLAGSDAGIVVEGNSYFPPESVHRDYLHESLTHTRCPWKGTGHSYNVVLNGVTNEDAAWCYPSPSSAAEQMKQHIAFWRGVVVEKEHHIHT